MVGLYYVMPEMGSFPMSVANSFCDLPLPKYLDSKTVLIYCPHPVLLLLYRVTGCDVAQNIILIVLSLTQTAQPQRGQPIVHMGSQLK